MMDTCTGKSTKDGKDIMGIMDYPSIGFERFQVNSTTCAIAKIIFTRACSREGVAALKWQTTAIWEELYGKMNEFCIELMDKKLKPMETKISRTDSLAISCKFIPITEVHKSLFRSEDDANSKENLKSNMKLLDYILCVSATLKREHRHSQCCGLSSVNSPMKPPTQAGKYEVTPSKNILAPRNTVKHTEKVQPKILTDSAKSPVHTVTSARSNKSNTTATVTNKRSRPGKAKNVALSLKHKDTSNKTQSEITKFFAKTPPSDKTFSKLANSQISPPTHTLKELSTQNISLKRKPSKEISDEEIKASKITRNLRSKENIVKEKATGETSMLRLSRSKIKEMKQNQQIQMISIGEEDDKMATEVMKAEAEDTPDFVMKTEKCKDGPNTGEYSSFTSKKSPNIKQIKIKEEVDVAVAGCSRTPDKIKCEDMLAEEDWAKQMEEFIPLIRSPIKASTPRRRKSVVENINLTAYDLPGDDPRYPQYLLDCEELKRVFITGEVDNVSKQLAERMYEIHLPYVEAVHNKKVFSLIYDTFSKDEDEGHKMDYTEGCIIFSEENLNMFAQSIGTRFSYNGDDHRKKLNYYLKVLVPELIIKIVMGVYKISKSEALDKMLEVGILVTECYGHVFF